MLASIPSTHVVLATKSVKTGSKLTSLNSGLKQVHCYSHLIVLLLFKMFFKLCDPPPQAVNVSVEHRDRDGALAGVYVDTAACPGHKTTGQRREILKSSSCGCL